MLGGKITFPKEKQLFLSLAQHQPLLLLKGSGAVGERRAANWAGIRMEALPEQCLFPNVLLALQHEGIWDNSGEEQEELLENVVQFENFNVFLS